MHKDGSVRWFLSRGSVVRACRRHAAPDGRAPRWTSPNGSWPKRRCARTRPCSQASHREIQDLAGRLIASQEVERARIARDLHDDLSQQLAGLSIALSGVKRRLGACRAPPICEATCHRSSSVRSRSPRTSAHLSHDLHPSVLEHAGLVAALAAYCAEIQGRHTVAVTFRADGDFDLRRPTPRCACIASPRKRLRNVVTHAGARRAEVRLSRTGDGAELPSLTTAGVDIVWRGKSGQRYRVGQHHERVRLAGGTVSIVTELNKGTRVRVQIPTNRQRGRRRRRRAGTLATTAGQRVSFFDMSARRTTVLIADDHAIVKEGLVSLLKEQTSTWSAPSATANSCSMRRGGCDRT